MVHCDPAPPHPPPGEVYNVICPPPGGWLVAIGLLSVLAIGMGLAFRYVADVGGDSDV